MRLKTLFGDVLRPLLVVFARVALFALASLPALGGSVALASCSAGHPTTPAAPASARPGSAGREGARGDGIAPEAAALKKPFAGSPSEATQLIGEAVDDNAAAVKSCVADYRARKKLPHERVEISVGIDQEGRLLGATLKGGKQDAPLANCLQNALSRAPFPRSHAGVIQMTKSYEEIER